MNWYKQAQFDFKWKRFITIFGITAVLGLASAWGMGLLDLKKVYEQNPQKIEQALQQQINENVTPVPTSVQSERVIEHGLSGVDISKMIERHEGKRNYVYIDTKGHPTIGIGFNLDRADAKEKLDNLGININNILNGQPLTDEQIYILFKDDLEQAIINAYKFLPDLDTHPSNIQIILTDMAFNMGLSKLSGFEDFKKALLNRNYSLAADEMIDSKWYNQVGNRSKELVSMMRSIK